MSTTSPSVSRVGTMCRGRAFGLAATFVPVRAATGAVAAPFCGSWSSPVTSP
jgi:hypothetical protein